MNGALYVGLMSGTSLDGADAVLAELSQSRPRILASAHVPFPADLRRALQRLCESGPDEIDRAGEAGVALARLYADAVRLVLENAGVEAGSVRAIGCHGQTVRHRPQRGYTVQIGSPAWLAQLVRIPVVADFRSRDIAAGGQGAPLVPAFHAAVFSDPGTHRAILNLGGIANLTDLTPGHPVRGFDCGPGNMLMDGWIARHRGEAFDRDGAWAAAGRVDAALLARLLEHPFLLLSPPKSTGREDFHLAWLVSRLAGLAVAPVDVMATLAQFTAQAAADAIARDCAGTREVYVCGGGARNAPLLARLGAALGPDVTVTTTAALGVAVDLVEALAFAWLAAQTFEGKPGNRPEVTGASELVVLGAIYPA